VSPIEKRRPATYADVLALPDGVSGEIIAGELVASPRPAPFHLQAEAAVLDALGRPFQYASGGPGGWWIIIEPELRLGIDPLFDPLIPDVAGWRRERMPHLPEAATFGMTPDWICEVLSPRTEARDRAEKMPFYARAGVGHAWLVDPLLFTLEIFRLDDGTWRMVAVHRESVQVRAEPFDAVEIDLSRLWQR
jgi:Uma2 family endonuclease